jgi:hypothetical protein
MRQVEWSVGHPTYIKGFVLARARFRGLAEMRSYLRVGSVFVNLKRSVLLSLRVASSIVLIGLREGPRCLREGSPFRTA